jgi:hypothetical protein
LERIFLPFKTTAAPVSSHDVSIASTSIAFTRQFIDFHFRTVDKALLDAL